MAWSSNWEVLNARKSKGSVIENFVGRWSVGICTSLCLIALISMLSLRQGGSTIRD